MLLFYVHGNVGTVKLTTLFFGRLRPPKRLIKLILSTKTCMIVKTKWQSIS